MKRFLNFPNQLYLGLVEISKYGLSKLLSLDHEFCRVEKIKIFHDCAYKDLFLKKHYHS